MNPRLPGCFGLSTTHNPASETCKACKLNARCKTEAYKIAEAVHQSVNVAGILERLRDKQVAAPKSEASVTVRKSAKQPKLQAEWSLNASESIPYLLRSGVNPIPERLKALRVICQCLLESPRVTRGQLLAALSKDSPALAQSTYETSISRGLRWLKERSVIRVTQNEIELR